MRKTNSTCALKQPPNTVDLLKKFGRSLFNRKKKSKTPVEETTEHGEQSSQTPSAAHDTPVNVPAVTAPPPPAAENAAAAAPQIEESREVAPTAAPAAETITPAPAPGVDGKTLFCCVRSKNPLPFSSLVS